jgi:hypothetical protein
MINTQPRGNSSAKWLSSFKLVSIPILVFFILVIKVATDETSPTADGGASGGRARTRADKGAPRNSRP